MHGFDYSNWPIKPLRVLNLRNCLKVMEPFRIDGMMFAIKRRVWDYRDGKLIETTRSVPTLYGLINSFQITATGNLTIVIRYVPQHWFELGLRISATTFALCIFYLIWDWRRGIGDRFLLTNNYRKFLSLIMRFRGFDSS